MNQQEPIVHQESDNFRQFFEAMVDMIVVGTPSGEVLFINSALNKKLGYTLDEVKSIGILGLNPKEKREEAETNFKAMLKGELEYCPLALVAKDGRWIPAETRVTFGKWDGRECVFGICKDMTEQHAALEKFGKIFASNPMPIAISSVNDRKFLDINQAFLDLLGYTKEEIIGRTSEEINLFENVDEQKALGEELKNTGKIANRELRIKKKGGDVLIGLFSGEIIDNQKGEKAYLTTMVNITDVKKAKQGLQENTTLLTNLLSSIPDIIFFKDSNGVYLGCNPEFVKFTGKSKDQIVGHTDYDIFPKEIADSFREQDTIMLKEGASRHNDEWITYPDGKRILIDTYKSTLRDSDGNTIGLVGVSRDITDRKEAEDELKKINSMMVGRELTMIEMKDRIAELEKMLGKPS